MRDRDQYEWQEARPVAACLTVGSVLGGTVVAIVFLILIFWN